MSLPEDERPKNPNHQLAKAEWDLEQKLNARLTTPGGFVGLNVPQFVYDRASFLKQRPETIHKRIKLLALSNPDRTTEVVLENDTNGEEHPPMNFTQIAVLDRTARTYTRVTLFPKKETLDERIEVVSKHGLTDDEIDQWDTGKGSRMSILFVEDPKLTCVQTALSAINDPTLSIDYDRTSKVV